jgi:DNA polymerase
MNMSTNSAFLKEMGITEWTERNASQQTNQTVLAAEVASPSLDSSVGSSVMSDSAVAQKRTPLGIWWFFGSKPQGDAELFFQNVIRVLGLMPQEWSWKNPAEKFNSDLMPQDGTPIVALAFGGGVAQRLSGERDALSELRETVLAINAEGAEDLPLIATFELNQLISRPKDKALFWQDILLARSVLQNI